MMNLYTDNPILDAERHYNEQERRLRKLPICRNCKEHIQQEKAVRTEKGWYCEDCEDAAWETIREEYLEDIG